MSYEESIKKHTKRVGETVFVAPRDITEGALFVVTLNGKKLRESIEYTTIRYGDIVNIVIEEK